MNWKLSIMFKSLLKIIEGLLLIGLFVALGLYLNFLFSSRVSQTANQPESASASAAPTPTPRQTDPTAGWKIYSDSRFGFSIKYPQNWSFFGNTTLPPNSQTDTTTYFYELANPPKLDLYEGIALSVEDNKKGLPVGDWPAQLFVKVTGGSKPQPPLQREQMTIAGRSALKVRGLPSRNTEYVVLVPYNQKILVVGLALDSANVHAARGSDYDQILLMMINTLRFP